MVIFVEHVIVRANHVMITRITIAFNVQMGMYKTNSLQTRTLKNASVPVYKEPIKSIIFVRHVIVTANHAKGAKITIALNVRMDLNKIEVLKLKSLKNVSLLVQ